MSMRYFLTALTQGLYSGQMEIWTATNTAQNRDNVNNFPEKAARNLIFFGRNSDEIRKDFTNLLHK